MISLFTPSLFNLSISYLSLSNKWDTRHPKKYSVPRRFADPYDKIMVFRENPAKIPVWEKSAKVFHSLYSSTEQLQVALWTFMFIRLELNNDKSSHTLPLQSPYLLSLHL